MTTRWPLLVLLGSLSASAQDLASGKDVYGPCAACHGANGEGGKQGEYPRVAGLPVTYLVDQLKAFQQRKRTNLPMFPYTEPRELSERDMKDVAAYMAQIVLPTRPPVFKPSDSALTRLLAMEKVLVVPKSKGDTEKGEAVYSKRCASCHGRSGQGRLDFPRLVGQYPTYLTRQVDLMRKNERAHEGESFDTDVLRRVSPEDLANILAWLTQIQDQIEEPAPDAGSP